MSVANRGTMHAAPEWPKVLTSQSAAFRCTREARVVKALKVSKELGFGDGARTPGVSVFYMK